MLGREVAKVCNISIRFNDRTTKEQGKPCTIAPTQQGKRKSERVKQSKANAYHKQ